MYNAKYVIIDGSAIVFSAAIQHKDMVGYNDKCQGAGFVTFRHSTNKYGEDIVTAHCYGKSVSLGIESNPERDSLLITHQITNPY